MTLSEQEALATYANLIAYDANGVGAMTTELKPYMGFMFDFGRGGLVDLYVFAYIVFVPEHTTWETLALCATFVETFDSPVGL